MSNNGKAQNIATYKKGKCFFIHKRNNKNQNNFIHLVILTAYSAASKCNMEKWKVNSPLFIVISEQCDINLTGYC